MGSTICLLTEWTMKVSGLYKAASVFLIKKGACGVVEDTAFQLGRDFGHAPKSVTNAFKDLLMLIPSYIWMRRSRLW